jgi:hypothetical protein
MRTTKIPLRLLSARQQASGYDSRDQGASLPFSSAKRWKEFLKKHLTTAARLFRVDICPQGAGTERNGIMFDDDFEVEITDEDDELSADYWDFDPYDEPTDEELEMWEQELLEEFLASADADEFFEVML